MSSILSTSSDGVGRYTTSLPSWPTTTCALDGAARTAAARPMMAGTSRRRTLALSSDVRVGLLASGDPQRFRDVAIDSKCLHVTVLKPREQAQGQRNRRFWISRQADHYSVALHPDAIVTDRPQHILGQARHPREARGFRLRDLRAAQHGRADHLVGIADKNGAH